MHSVKTSTLQTHCCIAGGGPAGMMLGLLLARSGVDVTVLEKHSDFFRDFRGDTIHPSTLEVMHELGILADLLKLPHQEMPQLAAQIGSSRVVMADFSHLPTRCKFIAFMPQWDFLNFLADYAKRYPGFNLRMNCEVTDLIYNHGLVVGVRAQETEGELQVHANLVIGADGRSSTIRQCAGLEVIDLGAPIDVLWMRISKQPGDPQQSLGRVDTGKILAMIDRGGYWQCAFVIPKNSVSNLKQKGLQSFRSEIANLAPSFRYRTEELRSWDDIKVLTVQVNQLRKWYCAGLLCIGDAAHAMSPVGGVGINLAIQDAVATANILAGSLLYGPVSNKKLQEVQHRRQLPTTLTQRLQILIQNGVNKNVLKANKPMSPPWFINLMQIFTILRLIPAFLIGIGFRPEHIQIRR